MRIVAAAQIERSRAALNQVRWCGVSSTGLKPLVLCPLRYELKQLQRGLGDRFEFICTGPGEAGIGRWAAQAHDVQRAVILAGLAGALSDAFRAGDAAVIHDVVDETASARWRPTLNLSTSGAAMPCVITSAPHVMVRAEDRQQLHQRCGADLVDQESTAFAQAATGLGLRWGIVRGISDDLETGILPLAAGLVDERGRTVPEQVLRAGCSKGGFRGLWRLARDSRQALASVRILLGKSAL